MAYCLNPDFPTVKIILEHLKDLEKQLKEEGVTFAPEASIHLREIMAAITVLETKRRTSHELLEVETIENSKLRHQMNYLLKRNSEGIIADVEAVRTSTAEEMDHLRKDLSTTNQLQEEITKKSEALLSQNKILQNEREQVRAEKDVIATALNEQIDFKYSFQMELDQTQRMVEEMKSSIAAIEQEKLALHQKMIQERDAFSEKKDTLEEEMEQTDEEISQQMHVIARRLHELERVTMRREEARSHLDQLNVHMRELENNMQQQIASRCRCEQELKEEIRNHQTLTQRRETLEKDLPELRKTFDLKAQNLQDEMAKIDAQKEAEQQSIQLIQETLSRVQKIFKHRQDEGNIVRAEHLRVLQQLERSNLTLGERIAAIVKHRMSIKEMARRTGELQEADAITRRVFKRNQEELCVAVDEEKDNIRLSEEKKTQLYQLLEETARRQEEHVAEMTSHISGFRRKYEDLLHEEAVLHRQQPHGSNADMLMSLVTKSEAESRQIEIMHMEEAQQLLAGAEEIIRTAQQKQSELQLEEDRMKEAEAKCNEEQSKHDQLHALGCELNRKRSELIRSIQEAKERTVSLLRPKEDMKKELQQLQSSYADMLGEQAAEVTAVEVELYDNAVKLEEVHVENRRLHVHIKQMTQDIHTTRQEMDRNAEDFEQLSRNMKVTCKSLEEARREDLSLTRDCQERDGAILAQMTSLMHRVDARTKELLGVSAVLRQHMLEFSERLGDRATLKHNSQ